MSIHQNLIQPQKSTRELVSTAYWVLGVIYTQHLGFNQLLYKAMSNSYILAVIF